MSKKEDKKIIFPNGPDNISPQIFDPKLISLIDKVSEFDGENSSDRNEDDPDNSFRVVINKVGDIYQAIRNSEEGLLAVGLYEDPVQQVIVELKTSPGRYNLLAHFNPVPTDVEEDLIDVDEIMSNILDMYGGFYIAPDRSMLSFEVTHKTGQVTKFVLQPKDEEGFTITTGLIEIDGRDLQKYSAPLANKSEVLQTLDNLSEVISFVVTQAYHNVGLSVRPGEVLDINPPEEMRFTRQDLEEWQDSFWEDDNFDFLEEETLELDQKELFRRVSKDRKVTFDDIGGYKKVIEELKMISMAIQNPEVYKRYGASLPNNLLLTGEPGVGKTLMAEALANETGVDFVSIDPSHIFGRYVGDSERNMAMIFDQLEKNEGMSILFIDEIDTLFESRSLDIHEVTRKVQGIFFQRIDGLRSSNKIFVVAATNKVKDLDSALVRSGRFDLIIEIERPDAEARAEIFKIHATYFEERADEQVFADFDWQPIIQATDGFTGADIKAFLGMVIREKVKKHLLHGEDQGLVTKEELLTAIDGFRKKINQEKKARKYGYTVNEQ